MQSYNAIDLEVSEGKQIGPQTSESNTPITEVRGKLSDFGIDDEEFIREFIEKTKSARRAKNDRCGDVPRDVIGEPKQTTTRTHPAVVFENEVPAIRDNYFERKERLFSGGWENQEHFLRLYNRNFGDFNQLQAESYLAAQFALTFGKCKDIVAWEMEDLDFQTEFEVNPKHRAYIFQVVEEVPYIYCEEVDLMTKHTVANELIPQKKVTVSELSNRIEVSRSHVSRVLNILETEGVAERVERGNKADWWMGDAVTKNYLNGLWEAKKRLEEKEE